MANKILIVHGYSDGSTSFTGLADYLVKQRLYASKDIYFVDYCSMDDDATFRDFADKLNDDYHRICPDFERIDVACHSTGALVTRAWLALHYVRNCKYGFSRPCPVDHLLMFAPANFGSDLAVMGQSFLGKTRTTFFNSHSYKGEDFFESGRQVLQGLEPASPFQWELSHYDLHGELGAYFNPKLEPQLRCYPFVFAAGNAYTGVQRLIKNRDKPGTDGTVRISGTSLNTRKCHFSFDGKTEIQWLENDRKYEDIPFAVFDRFNHGSIVSGSGTNFSGKERPGPLLKEALKVQTLEQYAALALQFRAVCKANYGTMDAEYRSEYQQFFFKVRDDVGQPIRDFFIDFYVKGSGGALHRELTAEFDASFELKYHRHSVDASCRALLFECSRLGAFLTKLKKAKASLVFDITAVAQIANISYKPGYYVVYDGKKLADRDELSFLYPNTTTLVDIVMNRCQNDKLMKISEYAEIVRT